MAVAAAEFDRHCSCCCYSNAFVGDGDFARCCTAYVVVAELARYSKCCDYFAVEAVADDFPMTVVGNDDS